MLITTAKKIGMIALFFTSSVLLSLIPRVSIITSLYNGDHHIEQFMEDIVKQTIFSQCELIIIDANSPGSEEKIIRQYLHKFPNIVYIKLVQDLGLYATWNMAIKLSKAEYIINANIDDNLKNDAIETFANILDNQPHIELVYADFMWTKSLSDTFETANPYAISRFPEFSKRAMIMCLPMNHPMWRKTVHKNYGYFNEGYKSVGDYEMWLRAVKQGAQFMKVNTVCGTWYQTPTEVSQRALHQKEIQEILVSYKDILQMQNLSAHEILTAYQNHAQKHFLYNMI